MLAIGFLSIFALSLFETFGMKKLSSFDKRYFSISLVFLCGSLFSMSIFLATDSENIYDDFMSLIKNPILYISIVVEIIGFSLSMANFKENGNNIKAINFSLIFSLVLVPLYGFIGNFLGLFPNALKVNYASNLEFVLFISIMMVLSCLFFIDKVKAGKINNIPLLAAYPVVLSLTMYLYGNLIQTASSFLVYAFIMMGLSVMFMITAWSKGELNDINNNTFKSIFPIILIWLCIVPLNVLSLKILAVEFVTIIKRVCQILVGVLLDKHFKNDSLVPLKDKIIIFVIVIITMLLYFYR